jgi:taurine--2-oxoglutarate transaminase
VSGIGPASPPPPSAPASPPPLPSAPDWTDDLTERQGRSVFYTWSTQRQAIPLEIVRAEGARFVTADGAEWLDLGSMTWNANLGHGHPAMRAALATAAARGLLTYPTSVFPDKARAGELLAEIAPPGMTKSFICLSGAEANENAVKMARLFTGRHKIVARDHSYHGATLAMLALSGDPRQVPFEAPSSTSATLPQVVRLVDPDCFHCPMGRVPETCHHECADALDALLRREDPSTVAAVILEGVVGANGVFVPPPGYWRRIREVCDRHGVLLIADEVLSGFGRTGRWFAVDHDGVTPDLLTVAKGLTGGYAPGGAVVVAERLDRFFDDHVLACGLTAYAHPLTCAAIVAAITSYRDEGLISRAASVGGALGEALRELQRTRPFIGDVRGVGMLWALELTVPGTRQPLGGAAVARVAAAVKRQHLHLHRRDHMLFVAPPLVVTAEDLREGLARLGAALDEARP